MMSYITPRFIALACIITMLFGAYNGIPCNQIEDKEARQGISEIPLTASPSGLLSSQNFTPLREFKPVQGGLDRRMMPMGGAAASPKKGGLFKTGDT